MGKIIAATALSGLGGHRLARLEHGRQAHRRLPVLRLLGLRDPPHDAARLHPDGRAQRRAGNPDRQHDPSLYRKGAAGFFEEPGSKPGWPSANRAARAMLRLGG
jgi:hypothetical protein